MRGSEYKVALTKISTQAAPIVAAQLGNMVLNAVGAGLFARLGRSYLIASGPMSMALGFYSSCNALVFPLNILICRAILGNAPLEVGSYFRQALMMSLWIAVGLSGPALWTGNLFELMGHSQAVGQIINQFFQAFICTGGLFPLFGQTVQRRLFVGLKKPKVSMSLIISNALLLLLGSAIAFQYVPHARGFGYAASVSSWLAFLGFIIYLAAAQDCRSYHLFKKSDWFDYVKWQEIFKEGFPVMVSNTLECLIVAILSGAMGHAGDEAAEAYGVANQYIRLVIYVAAALSGPVGTLMTEKASSVLFKTSFFLSMGLALPGALMSLIYPEAMVRPFAGTLNSVTKKILVITSLSNIADAVRLVSNGAGRPFKRNQQSMWINLTGLALGLIAALGCEYGGLGPVVALIGFGLGVMGAALMQVRDVYVGMSEGAMPLLNHAINSEGQICSASNNYKP